MIQPKIYLQDLTPQQLQFGLSYVDQQRFDVTSQNANQPSQQEKIQRIFNRLVCMIPEAEQNHVATIYRERMPAAIYQLYENSIKAKKVVSLIPVSNINLPSASPALIEQCQRIYNVITQYGVGKHLLHPCNIASIRKAVTDEAFAKLAKHEIF